MKSIILAILIFLVAICSSSCFLFSDNVIVYFAGSLNGYIGDCGCNGDPAGGIARRFGYINKDRIKNTLHVDVGAFSNGLSRAGIERTSKILSIYEKYNLDCVNVASKDLLLGFELLNKWSINYISSNIIYSSDSRKVFPAYRIITINGFRIGFIGVTAGGGEEYGEGNRQIEIGDLKKCLDETIRDIHARTDMIIVLAHGNYSDLSRQLKGISRIDLIILSSNLPANIKHKHISGTKVVFTGTQGKYLGRIKIESNEDNGKIYHWDNILLNSKVEEQAEILQLIQN